MIRKALIYIFSIFLVISFYRIYDLVFYQTEEYQKQILPRLEEIEKNYHPMMFDGEMEPAHFPNKYLNNIYLLGIDENKNGIRDDLEIYINRSFKYDYERISYKESFIEYQKFLIENKDKTEDRELLKRIFKIGSVYNCLFYLKDSYHLPLTDNETLKYISFLFYNNKLRKEFYYDIYSNLKPGEYLDFGTFSPENFYNLCPSQLKAKYKFKQRLN